TLTKFVGWADQAQDQKSITRKIIKMPGMHKYGTIAHQFDGQVFIRSRYWYSQHCIPSAFDIQPGAYLLNCELTIQLGKICPDSLQQLLLYVFSLRQQSRNGPLHWSIHGEIGVSNDFKPLHCGGNLLARATGDDPCNFHLG